ncbi:unnamed protein product, partial [Larinioides sclopetarius]
MKFLDDVEPVEPSTSNLNEACESSQLSLQDISDNEAVDDPLSCSLLSINEPFEVLADVPPNPVVSRKRKRTNPETDLLLKACETLNNVASSQISAEDALGQYIAQKLKTINDPIKKNAAESDL